MRKILAVLFTIVFVLTGQGFMKKALGWGVPVTNATTNSTSNQVVFVPSNDVTVVSNTQTSNAQTSDATVNQATNAVQNQAIEQVTPDQVTTFNNGNSTQVCLYKCEVLTNTQTATVTSNGIQVQ